MIDGKDLLKAIPLVPKPEAGQAGDTGKSAHSSGWVGVHTSAKFPGNTIYVGIDDRAAFDLIDLPQGDNGKVLTKVIDYKPPFNDAGPQYLIFQHWLVKPTVGLVEHKTAAAGDR
jgi:hypothetical protein